MSPGITQLVMERAVMRTLQRAEGLQEVMPGGLGRAMRKQHLLQGLGTSLPVIVSH